MIYTTNLGHKDARRAEKCEKSVVQFNRIRLHPCKNKKIKKKPPPAARAGVFGNMFSCLKLHEAVFLLRFQAEKPTEKRETERNI